MFGNTLVEVMELQREIFPERKIPWIQHTLSEQILLMQGKQTEGLFRVPADVDEVMCLKAYVDKWEFPDNKGTMGKFLSCHVDTFINLFVYRCSRTRQSAKVVVSRVVRSTDTWWILRRMCSNWRSQRSDGNNWSNTTHKSIGEILAAKARPSFNLLRSFRC